MIAHFFNSRVKWGFAAVFIALGFAKFALAADALKLATFDVDATPPIGSMMAYQPCRSQGELGLRARGVVILGSGQPIVLCAVDWIGIGNEGHDAFCEALAAAAGTTPSRVAVHTLHQHDAPACDFGAEAIIQKTPNLINHYNGAIARDVMDRLKSAIELSVKSPRPVTHIGLGKAAVKEVASNRRIMGPDGKVRAVRFTSTTNPALRAEPEGVIDPDVSLISFWNNSTPIAVLSYYACHPQSYYLTGVANPDFPGIARYLRSLAVPDVLHVHFNGAGGNIGAGKYNDGSHANRLVLAERLADGMRRAWEATEKTPVAAADVGWAFEPVALPPSKYLVESDLEAAMHTPTASLFLGIPAKLAFLHRCQAGHKIDIACLSLGKARVVHMPGELFVEYQLAAKKLRPDLFVTMAAYGDYGPGYIGTAIAYPQGGYETSRNASHTAPEVEGVLMGAVEKLLKAQ